MRKLVLCLLALLGLLVPARVARAEGVILKFGTVAPPASPWGKVFKVWARATAERSHGAVQIQFFWNATQGDESAMVGKMRTGQLDGAAVTAIGLGQVYKQCLVFELPGLFPSWAKLDEARTALEPQMNTEFERQGFKIVGWGDIGTGRFMSAGFPVRSPADVRHRKTFYIPGDPVDPVFYSVLGDITPQAMSETEVLTALTAGQVNVINVPPLAAEQLQWAARMDHIDTLPTHFEIGALIMSLSRVQSLPPDAQAAVIDTGRVASQALTASIRREDDAAFARRTQRMTPYTPGAAEVAQWSKLFADTRAKLRGTAFTPAIYDEAAKYSR